MQSFPWGSQKKKKNKNDVNFVIHGGVKWKKIQTVTQVVVLNSTNFELIRSDEMRDDVLLDPAQGV